MGQLGMLLLLLLARKLTEAVADRLQVSIRAVQFALQILILGFCLDLLMARIV